MKPNRRILQSGFRFHSLSSDTIHLPYNNGHGVEKDYVEAVKWYRKAADQGNAQAQYNLGVMYRTGQGVANDSVETVKWFRKAAEQGFASAQFELGLMYANGQGVEKDYVEALKWYRKAVEQGDSDAQFNLGFMLIRLVPNGNFSPRQLRAAPSVV